MPIVVKHGRPETLITAAQLAGAARKQEDIQKMQMEFDYRQALRQQDMAIDLQMQERAKQWEIDKMQLRSQIDFQREEQVRQRKLDSIDSALQQIDKEVLAGRMTDKEAYPLKLKYEMNRLGVDAPTSLLPPGDEEREEGFGIRPYWMRGREAAEGTPERQLYEAKLAEGISGQRAGTVPYYLDPTWLRETDRDVVDQVLASREIFFDTPEELDAFIERMERRRGAEELPLVVPPRERLPLAGKELDVGVRSGTPAEVPLEDKRIRVVSPEGQTGTILENELQEYKNRGFEVIGEAAELTTEIIPPTIEDTVEQLEVGEVQRRKKAYLGKIDWDYMMSKGFK